MAWKQSLEIILLNGVEKVLKTGEQHKKKTKKLLVRAKNMGLRPFRKRKR